MALCQPRKKYSANKIVNQVFLLHHIYATVFLYVYFYTTLVFLYVYVYIYTTLVFLYVYFLGKFTVLLFTSHVYTFIILFSGVLLCLCVFWYIKTDWTLFVEAQSTFV